MNLNIEKLETERLLLIPFTKQLCHLINDKNFIELKNKGLNASEGYPDLETLDTIPKIIANIELSDGPTGFESWVIISKKEMKIIGDIGFKGFLIKLVKLIWVTESLPAREEKGMLLKQQNL